MRRRLASENNSEMKIAHVSDTHGDFPEIDRDVDVIVHSGDMIPNIRRADRSPSWNFADEMIFQHDWIFRHTEQFQDWIGDTPLLICSGNHDFVSLAATLSDILPKVHNLDLKRVELNGVVFAGFPYIPRIVGEWVRELEDDAMRDAVDKLVLLGWNQDKMCDVLVSHCPPNGVLDKDSKWKGGGIKALTTALNYTINPLPKYLLCGHFHESHGEEMFDTMKVINSATTVTYLEV